MDAPRRRARHPDAAERAKDIAQLLYPSKENPLGALIKYEKDIVMLRALVLEQRKRVINDNIARKEDYNWEARIIKQGPWDPVQDPWSLDGAPSLPMPVKIAEHETLEPFFEHLSLGGNEEKASTARAKEEALEIEEPYYKIKSLEFEKGVVYSDRRMDLCKMVLGPPNIGNLLESLKTNTFITHFLLGNNIIGPTGAKAIAEFCKEFPNRMDTWYLAGNCIDTASFKILVDEWVKSTSVTNIWLKRNPLRPAAANDLFRLITQTPNLRTLDLDQTELGDAGVADLFERLVEHTIETPLPLRHLYLNGAGVGTRAATAIAKFLESPQCALDSLYMGHNPIGNSGAIALAAGLRKNKSLTRLMLISSGISDDGAIAVFEALEDHPAISALGLGQQYATQDLGSRYNWISDRSAHAIHNLILSAPKLCYLNLDAQPLTHVGLNLIYLAILQSPTIIWYDPRTIWPQERSYPAIKAGQEHKKNVALAREHLAANVKRIYGITYDEFRADQKRWVVSDQTDVRKIDSVYRNRDSQMARRGLKVLDKLWDEDDETLQKVMDGAVGPTCSMRKAHAVVA
ncbi:RNI-like protein [Periconia macrospinosa]|uniref:RNI-like protein n=1 Tax=Periconia macrospinosa TaxID=97972 RepID=A0A2V1DZ64_9PLEO|nr:RNI-like protein [Periconia macrospinosa]